jgi:hypothetical protein
MIGVREAHNAEAQGWCNLPSLPTPFVNATLRLARYFHTRLILHNDLHCSEQVKQ